MDRIDEMRIFGRVVETGSFRGAARALGLPPSTVTDAIKRAEARLGVRLLDRTTRHVAPTLDGEAWYRQCLHLVAAMEDAEAAFRGGEPQGRVRLDVNGPLARNFLLPALPDFLARYPELDLVLSEGERLVDLIREGVDCVIRAAPPEDSDLIRRSLGSLPEVTVASAEYLARHGHPRSLEDLDGHKMIGFWSSRTGDVLPLEFTVGGRTILRKLPAAVTVTGADSLAALVRQGLGLIQAPRYHLQADIKAGRLVEVLPDCPPSPLPLAALYPRDRQRSPRLRVLLDWLQSLDFGGSGEA